MKLRKPTALSCALLMLCATTGGASAAYVLVNGDFEDTSGTFPNGWSGSSTFDAGGFASGSHDAGMSSGGSITQDFSGSTTVATAENYDFQLDFAFRTDALSTSSDQRFRLRDHNNSGDLITLGFETSATGGGTALSYYNGTSWATAINSAFSSGTTYHFRVTGTDLDLASRFYTVGFSTDGVNYTTSGTITAFHSAAPGPDFETIRFEAGNSTLRIDAVTVVPEPAAALLGGLASVTLLRRRRA